MPTRTSKYGYAVCVNSFPVNVFGTLDKSLDKAREIQDQWLAGHKRLPRVEVRQYALDSGDALHTAYWNGV